MIKKLLALTLPFLLLLSACGAQPNAASSDTPELSIVATTYPIYLFASEVTKGAKGVVVSPLVNQKVSCLHDYTLTVNDMKTLEGADVLLLSGAALDNFVLEASHSNPDLQVIDCSKSLALLPAREESNASDPSNHEHDGVDPHFWLDPLRAAAVIESIGKDLSDQDPTNAALYQANATAAAEKLRSEYTRLYAKLAPLTCRKLITFHDGFSYFANAFDLDLLMSVEEEEGQEASAQVIAQALALIKANGLPAIFTEEFSSDATAQAIVREASTPIKVYPLSLIMSGETENAGIDRYLAGLEQNIDTLLEALQ